MDLFTVLFSVIALLYLIAFIRCLSSCCGPSRRRRYDDDDDMYSEKYYDDSFQTPDYSHRYDRHKTPMRSSLKKKRSPSTERIRRMRHVKFEDEVVSEYN